MTYYDYHYYLKQQEAQRIEQQLSVIVASVPGLPNFDLPFAFTIIHGIEDWRNAPVYYCERKRKVKTGEAWERGYSNSGSVLLISH